jgi:hypothetical protein
MAAMMTKSHAERKSRLRLFELLGRQEFIGQGGFSKIEELFYFERITNDAPNHDRVSKLHRILEIAHFRTVAGQDPGFE